MQSFKMCENPLKFHWGYNYPKFSVWGMKTPLCLDCATLTILASTEWLSSKTTYLLKQHHVGFRVNIAVISNHHVDIIGNCHLKQHHVGFRVNIAVISNHHVDIIGNCHLKQHHVGFRVNIAVISNHHVDIIWNCHLKQHHAGFQSKFQSLQ